MSQTHDNALFIQPEEGVHDGCFLYTKPRCPIKFAQWQAMIEALPVEPSQSFLDMTRRMAAIKEVKPKGTKGGDAVPAKNIVQPVTI